MFKEINTLKPFFEDPTNEFNVREIARILKITPATASKRLKLLKKQGFLKYRKESILDLYKSNLDSEKYRDLKIYYNIRKLKDSGLIASLNEFYLKPTIILFGSASLGLDTKESDIDLLIISEKTKEFKKDFNLNRNLQLFVHKDINEIKNKHLLNNILNGIVIQGEIRWI